MFAEVHTPPVPWRHGAAFLIAMILVAMAAVMVLPGTVARADGPTAFNNPAAMTSTSPGPGPVAVGPFPSDISVSGMTGTISAVTVTLHDVTSISGLTDLDALLVSPTGANLVIMSDAGASNSYSAAADATITLADGGAAFPTTPGAVVQTGTYAP